MLVTNNDASIKVGTIFLMEIEHDRNSPLWQYKHGYHVWQVVSHDRDPELWSHAVIEVTEADYIELVQKWYHYYQQCKFEHPIKYRRAKRLWMKHRPARP